MTTDINSSDNQADNVRIESVIVNPEGAELERESIIRNMPAGKV